MADAPPVNADGPTASEPLSRRARRRRLEEVVNDSDVAASAGAVTAIIGAKKLKKSAFLPLTPSDTTDGRARRCVIEYDGTHFNGFQAQEQHATMRTVQEIIEDAVARTTGETVRVKGCSRTDKGVHARGQVVVFTSRCAVVDDGVFRDALNTRLPEDVVCRSLQTLDAAAFDPRTNAIGKIYEYVIVSGAVRPVLDRHHVWFLKKPLDTTQMRAAIAHLTAAPAAKDFSAFTPPKSSQQNRETAKGNVCTLTKVELLEAPLRPREEGEDDTKTDEVQRDTGVRIRIRFHGDRFLYKMVRNLVGTLVDVGLGRILPDSIPMLFETKDRSKAGQGAPPHGLTLVRVLYKKPESDA